MILPLLAESDPTAILRDMEAMKVWGAIIGGLILIERLWAILDRWRGRVPRIEAEVSERVNYAPTPVVDKLKKELEDFIEGNRSAHQAAATAGQQRLTDLANVLDSEAEKLSDEIDGIKQHILERMDRLHAELANKLDSVTALVNRHDATIPQIDLRVKQLTEDHVQSVQRLHNRIDDAMRRTEK